MSETNAPSGTDAPTTPQGQQPNPSTPPASASPAGTNAPQASTNDNQIQNPEAYRYAQEAADLRKQVKALQDAQKASDDAKLTAEQKRERDYTDLQTKAFEYEANLQRLHLENAGLRLAPALGIADPSAALALVQAEHGHEIKYAADGRPENLQDLFKAVLKDHPVLAAQAQRTPPASSGGASNPGRQAGNGGLTLDMIRAMPMRERIARMDEIRAWEKAQQSQQQN